MSTLNGCFYKNSSIVEVKYIQIGATLRTMTFQTNKVFTNLIQLLNERNFITRQNLLRANNTEFISYKYGPAGASLRNNLINKWREDVQFSEKNEACFFVENSTLINSRSLSQKEGLSSPEYISNILRMCAGTILGRTDIPFTIAQIGVWVNYQKKKDEKIFLFDSNEVTTLTLLHFCPPNLTQGTFETVLERRLRWWQQFANNSTNFQQMQTNENIPKTTNKDNPFLSSSGIQFHFPWGWNPVEKMIVLSNKTYPLNKECSISKSGLVDDTLTASVVISNVTLENGLLAVLYDSCAEKSIKIKTLSNKIKDKTNPLSANSATKSRTVLKLHRSLSPYKVGIVIYGKKVKHLRLLAERVIKELKTLNLQVLGFAPAETSSSLESQCLAYEQIGVLYLALINDKSLETGLIRILDNKEEVEMEPVYISNIKEYIIKKLKLGASS